MAKFVKGIDLCRNFFFEMAKPIIDTYYPELRYSAGLIGYGSDVLGYDDEVSRDHMWGPRFYMFLYEDDIDIKDDIFKILTETLPYIYHGYSVNFTEPDPDDNGVQHAKLITEGKVNPLIFIMTFDEFLRDELGTCDIEHLGDIDWLTISEHRLLSLVSGTFFVDDLELKKRLEYIRYYPDCIRRYLIASNWDIISSEQAFVKRCADVGDDVGSMIICARMAERLMRLCFLYRKVYAPYSKWFGTAFERLDIDKQIKEAVSAALHASNIESREDELIKAQIVVARLHNESGITSPIDYRIESYYGRDIKVIFADKFAEATAKTLKGTAFENIPLIGTFSQMGGLSCISDDRTYYDKLKRIYAK